MSVVRADRTGPTSAASFEWKMVKKRVTPSSTFSSTTMSAELIPVGGRALGALSILTTSAGRFRLAASSTCRSVNGHASEPGSATPGAGAAVGVGRRVVVGFVGDDGRGDQAAASAGARLAAGWLSRDHV